ncbi:citryl-CoA lyase, partial [Noviherbaspirillum sp.]|uniref:citryl-CoA lyase n=1 Tax=Noviherbaspirillum sp. TaxID=1926288 RepID=UPI002D6A6672
MSVQKNGKTAEQLLQETSAWWSTDIIDIHPGKIGIRGYPIQDLIGAVRFPDMIWLMLRGELPGHAQSALLEAALVASVDHGPQAPSIAISRMAVTCGLPLNGAMASAINALDDVHGGAGQQCMEIYSHVAGLKAEGRALADAVDTVLDRYTAVHGKIIPGFGHRFHPTDPRTPKLLQLVEDARR